MSEEGGDIVLNQHQQNRCLHHYHHYIIITIIHFLPFYTTLYHKEYYRHDITSAPQQAYEVERVSHFTDEDTGVYFAVEGSMASGDSRLYQERLVNITLPCGSTENLTCPPRRKTRYYQTGAEGAGRSEPGKDTSLLGGFGVGRG